MFEIVDNSILTKGFSIYQARHIILLFDLFTV